MNETLNTLFNMFVNWGFSQSFSGLLSKVLLLLILIGVALVVEYIITFLVLRLIKRVRSRFTANSFFYFVTAPKVIKSTGRLIAPFILITLFPLLFTVELDKLMQFFLRLCNVYIIVVILRVITYVMTAVYEVYSAKEELKNRPLRGILQTAQIIVLIIGAIIVVSAFTGKEPAYLLAGLGASAAVFMLVFQDSILGVVSGIQLSANNMLSVGDWITVPKHGADGTVIEVSLNTVKVQNFDKTITTLPPYVLVKDSFQNWKGMVDSNGRRVKRHINIDMSSVKFCSQEMIERFKKIDLLKEYISEKQEEINAYNQAYNVDTDLLVNGRHQTNLGVFRQYITLYLQNNSRVNKNSGFLCMVRQLQPTEIGIPLELYFFSDTSSWVPYEDLQSDVFDHVLAAVSEFDLRVFQSPTGYDLSKLS